MSTEPDRQHEIHVDLTQPPINIGADLGGAVLPLVADIAHQMDPEARFHMLHGFCAAIFGAMTSMVGIDNSEAILDALRTYGQNIRAEEAQRAAAAKGMH